MRTQTTTRISLNEFLNKSDFTDASLLSASLIEYIKLVKVDLLSDEELQLADHNIKTFQQRLAHKATILTLTFDSLKRMNATPTNEKLELFDTLTIIQKNFKELLTLKAPKPLALEQLLISLNDVNHTFISFNTLLCNIDVRTLNYRAPQHDQNTMSADDKTRKEIKDFLLQRIILLEEIITKENHPLYTLYTETITNLLIIYTSEEKVLIDTNPFIQAIQAKNYTVLDNVNHAELEFSVFIEAAHILHRNNSLSELTNLLYNHAHFINTCGHPLLNSNDFMSILNIHGFTIDQPICTTQLSSPPHINKANKKGCNVRFNETVQATAIQIESDIDDQSPIWKMVGSINWSLRPDISEMATPESGYITSDNYSKGLRLGSVNSYVRSDKESWVTALTEAKPIIIERN